MFGSFLPHQICNQLATIITLTPLEGEVCVSEASLLSFTFTSVINTIGWFHDALEG